MILRARQTWCSCLGHPFILGFLCLSLLSATLSAETIEIRNDSKATLVIQAACVVNGNVRRERPVTLRAGAKMSIKLPGNKLITVYDANMPNRVLHQSTVPAAKDDGAYSLEPDAKTGRLQLSQVKQVKERK